MRLQAPVTYLSKNYGYKEGMTLVYCEGTLFLGLPGSVTVRVWKSWFHYCIFYSQILQRFHELQYGIQPPPPPTPTPLFPGIVGSKKARDCGRPSLSLCCIVTYIHAYIHNFIYTRINWSLLGYQHVQLMCRVNK